MLSRPRHFQAIFTNYPYFICGFPAFLTLFVDFGRIDPYLATDCRIKQINRRMSIDQIHHADFDFSVSHANGAQKLTTLLYPGTKGISTRARWCDRRVLANS